MNDGEILPNISSGKIEKIVTLNEGPEGKHAGVCLSA